MKDKVQQIIALCEEKVKFYTDCSEELKIVINSNDREQIIQFLQDISDDVRITKFSLDVYKLTFFNDLMNMINTKVNDFHTISELAYKILENPGQDLLFIKLHDKINITLKIWSITRQRVAHASIDRFSKIMKDQTKMNDISRCVPYMKEDFYTLNLLKSLLDMSFDICPIYLQNVLQFCSCNVDKDVQQFDTDKIKVEWSINLGEVYSSMQNYFQENVLKARNEYNLVVGDVCKKNSAGKMGDISQNLAKKISDLSETDYQQHADYIGNICGAFKELTVDFQYKELEMQKNFKIFSTNVGGNIEQANKLYEDYIVSAIEIASF